MSGPGSEAEAVVAEFAEQFSVDVSAIGGEQRSRLFKALGDSTFGAVVANVHRRLRAPRAGRAGSAGGRCGVSRVGWRAGRRGITPPIRRAWCSTTFCRRWPGCASSTRSRRSWFGCAEPPSTTAGCANRCAKGRHWTPGVRRRCTATSSSSRLSTLLDEPAKAALRYADGLIWSPAHLAADDAVGVRSRFSDAEAIELTFDVMRNASNKIAVSLGGDAPRVEHGTEHYLLDVDGQVVYS